MKAKIIQMMKIGKEEMIPFFQKYGVYLIIAFFFCYMVQVKDIFIANIAFGILFLTKCRNLRFSKKALVSYLLFTGTMLISTIAFAGQRFPDIRDMIKLVFNFQYIFFLMDFDYDNERLDRYIFYCALAVSGWICATYVISGTAAQYNIIQLQSMGRMWGQALTPGWCNVTVLPILYGLYLNLFVIRNNLWKTLLVSAFFCVTLLLITSRTGFLGAVALISIYLVKCVWGLPKKTRCFVLGGGAALTALVAFFFLKDSVILPRLLYTADRREIMAVCIDYIKQRPILGFGGNSLSVVMEILPNSVSQFNWGHTHNTILELLIRYGSLGTAFFLLMVGFMFFKMKSSEGRCVYVLFWVLSLFQIYFRTFVFMLIIILLIKRYSPSNTDDDVIEVKLFKKTGGC